MSSPAASNTGSASLDERGQPLAVAPSGSSERRMRPSLILPHSSPTRSPAAAARSARASARRSASPPLPAQYRASTRSVSRARSISPGGTSAAARSNRLDGGAVVLPERRAAAAGGQAPPRRRGQLAVAGSPELGAVAAGLLEVVAEDLVQLDELGAVLLEPGREALVEVCAGRLRQRVVGGVADQEVAEAEAVLARELRLVGADQLPCGRARPGAASPGSRRVRAPGRRRGGRSRPRSRPARARSARPSRAGRGAPRAAPAAWAGRPRRPPPRRPSPASPR